MGSEPQAVAWRGVIDGRTVLLARDDVELERLARDYRCEIEPLVPASAVASLEARVSELEAAMGEAKEIIEAFAPLTDEGSRARVALSRLTALEKS